MKKFAITSLALLTLAGCSAVTTKIKVDDTLKQQPELAVKTSGMFWGLGRSGNFDMAGLYKAITAEIRAIHGGCQLTMLTLN
ncbi:hypothetical protein [Photobacterium sanguinicancri]|uniref:hypothetical protein n=1 Tax=Photobacterium sanguinicancri TaxID=875932 RepID=UPI0007897EA7|nr:hypothetical protein [Photobacterium sanguinicancri]KXI23005.1 hypothetical protein AS132_10820 [Photobacterium sanguinicancri]